ncbi:MAG: hypothetical protein ACM3RX_09415 [Methanococcaceae archaeon]
MLGEDKTTEELLFECNKLGRYLNVHPFCYNDELLIEKYRKPDPISNSHIEWIPETKKLRVVIKYYTDQYPYYERDIKEVSEEHFDNSLKALYHSLKSEAIQKARNEIPEDILNHIASEKVESLLEQ